jgi:hypothetical protein
MDRASFCTPKLVFLLESKKKERKEGRKEGRKEEKERT